MYDIVRYRVRYPYDIGRKIVRLFALIVRYLYVIAPYIGRTSAVNRPYIALVRCTLHLPPTTGTTNFAISQGQCFFHTKSAGVCALYTTQASNPKRPFLFV